MALRTLSLLFFWVLAGVATAMHADSLKYRLIKEHSDDVQVVAVSPNGKYVATGSWDKTIKVMNVDSGYSWMSTLRGHASAVNALAFSRDGNFLISGGNDYRVIVWKLSEDGAYFALDTTITNAHTSPITDVLMGPGMRMIYTAGADGKVMIYDRIKRKARMIDNKSPITNIALSTDRRFIFCTDESTLMKQYDAFGKIIRTFEGHSDYVNAVVYTINNKYVITGGSDKTIIVWNPLTGKEVRRLEGHEWKVTSLSVSPDSKYLLSGSSDGSAKLWDIESGAELKSFEGIGSNVQGVSLSPDSRLAFIAMHMDSKEDEFGVVAWETGIEPPAAAKPGQPAPLPKHLQKYAPKTPGATPAKRGATTPKPTKPPVKDGQKVLEETDEVKIMQDK